jgi:hypothetical protein
MRNVKILNSTTLVFQSEFYLEKNILQIFI